MCPHVPNVRCGTRHLKQKNPHQNRKNKFHLFLLPSFFIFLVQLGIMFEKYFFNNFLIFCQNHFKLRPFKSEVQQAEVIQEVLKKSYIEVG